MVYVISILISLFSSPPQTYIGKLPTVEVVWVEPVDTLLPKRVRSAEESIRHYKPLFNYISYRTGFPESLIFAILWQEHRKGSSLLLSHNNIGNVKWRESLHSKYKKACFKDDKYVGGRLVCSNFVSYPSLKEGADDFVKLLNSRRYQKCKGLPPKATCACFKKAGYHTDDSHWARAKNMQLYESIIQAGKDRPRHKQAPD